MTNQDNSASRPRLRAGLRRLAQRLLTPRAASTGEGTDTGPVTVTFSRHAPVQATPGMTLLHLARAHDIDISHYCGGMASCGTCRVEILSGAQNLSPMDGREGMVLGYESASAGHRLACQARVQGAVTVGLPRWL